VSALAQGIEAPLEPHFDQALAYTLATASDLRAGLAGVLASARTASRASRVEWWEGDEFVAASGLGTGPVDRIELAGVGAFVFFGGHVDCQLAHALEALSPLLRRLRADEALAVKVGELVRRNQALEEFAGFVAHELRTPLQEALLVEDDSVQLHEALDLVDALLRDAQDVSPMTAGESPAECVDSVVRTLGARADGLEVTFALGPSLPITTGALCIILRNFLSNAVSAGARHVHVSSPEPSSLVVDDDGVGLAKTGYESGSGLGLELCRRIARTFGARIELTPRRYGGTRAALVFGGVS
jgi:signal transduction histidine kinase